MDVTGMVVLLGVVIFWGWVVSVILEWRKLKFKNDLQNKIIGKFDAVPELNDFLQTNGGNKFLNFLTADGLDPKQKLLSAISKGVILLFIGIALLFIGPSLSELNVNTGIFRALWFYIYKTCGDENMADDIFQESFYKYLRAEPVKLNEFQQRAYLYKIAYRLIIDQKRKIKTEREKSREVEVKFEMSKEQEVFMALDMEKIFKLLKPEERTLLWLAYAEGYSHNEIAAIIGSKEKSIKVRLFRVKKKFAAILHRKGYNGEVKN